MTSTRASGQPITVLVHGSSGKMGREVVNAVSAAPDLRMVGAVDRFTDGAPEMELPNRKGKVAQGTDIGALLDKTKPRVMIDFSLADASMNAARAALGRGVCVVVGTTGHSDANLKEIDALASEHGVGAVVAPNFALSTVLLIHLAKEVARFFDYVDVIEEHHEQKIDSPSGTALSIAKALVEGKGAAFQHPNPEKEPLPGARGGEYQGISVHSIRMPGKLAHHEILLGAPGQTMSLRSDTITRECYMPGVLLAVREVVKHKGLVFGLEKLVNL